jgi:TolB-like protein
MIAVKPETETIEDCIYEEIIGDLVRKEIAVVSTGA